MKTHLKKDVLLLLGAGHDIKTACFKAGISTKTFQTWCKKYPRFKSKAYRFLGAKAPKPRVRRAKSKKTSKIAVYLIYAVVALACFSLGWLIGDLLINLK